MFTGKMLEEDMALVKSMSGKRLSEGAVSFDENAAEDFFNQFGDSSELKEYIRSSDSLVAKAKKIQSQLKDLVKEAAQNDFPDYLVDSHEMLSKEISVIEQWNKAAREFLVKNKDTLDDWGNPGK